MNRVEQLLDIRQRDHTGDVDLGYLIEDMTGCHLPMTNPGDIKEWVRVNGRKQVRWERSVRYPLPYGAHLLLILSLFSKAREDNSELITFSSTNALLEYTHLPRDDHWYEWAQNGLDRLLGAQVFIDEELQRDGEQVEINKRSEKLGDYIVNSLRERKC